MAEAVTVELDAQYRQLREECGLLDRSERGKLLLRGAEAAEYLQGQLTNDIEGLEPGEGCYAALLDRKGHMQADMRVLRLARGRDLGRHRAGAAAGGLAAISRCTRSGARSSVEDVTADARAALADRAAQRRDRRRPAASRARLRTARASAASTASRSGTALGIDLIATPAEDASGCAPPWPAPARSRSAPRRPRSSASRRVRRASAPRWTARRCPPRPASSRRAVDFEKGCYIGQETVARLHYRGKPNRHLRGLRLSAPAATGAPLALGDKEVGRVGGSCVSPVHGPIALAILRREAEPGAELAVGEDGVTARVVDLPFG